MIKYGIMADIHKANYSAIIRAIDLLKSRVDKLVINGDIGDDKQSIEFILQNVAKTNIETYAQPGSHETINDVEAQKGLLKKYTNLHIITQPTIFRQSDHDIILLPGSMSHTKKSENGYYLANESDQSGLIHSNSGDKYYTNIKVLAKLVENPEKTIVFCHDSCKTETIKHGPDYAYSGNLANGFIPGALFEQQIKNKLGYVPDFETLVHLATQEGIELKKYNAGRISLRDAFNKIGIKKAISAHFHEASHNACDSNNLLVDQNQFVNDLFWHAGTFDFGHTGILTVEGNKVKYENIKLNL